MLHKLRTFGVLGLVLAGVGMLSYSSCGDGEEFNLYQPISEAAYEKDKEAQLEEAKILIDSGKYGDAKKALDTVFKSDAEMNDDAKLIYAAAVLGEAGLDVWSIISKILDSSSSSSSSKGGGGMDSIFNSISDSVLGTGATRTARITALAEVLRKLLGVASSTSTSTTSSTATATAALALQSSTASGSSTASATSTATSTSTLSKKVKNTACLFAGLLAVPTMTDATASMNAALTQLGLVRDQSSSGGAVCPDTTGLVQALSSVTSVSGNFALVLQAAKSCAFINLDETTSLMNSVESSLARLKYNADKGCASLPDRKSVV